MKGKEKRSDVARTSTHQQHRQELEAAVYLAQGGQNKPVPNLGGLNPPAPPDPRIAALKATADVTLMWSAGVELRCTLKGYRRTPNRLTCSFIFQQECIGGELTEDDTSHAHMEKGLPSGRKGYMPCGKSSGRWCGVGEGGGRRDWQALWRRRGGAVETASGCPTFAPTVRNESGCLSGHALGLQSCLLSHPPLPVRLPPSHPHWTSRFLRQAPIQGDQLMHNS
ncbi:hypothetical protein SKAU_G00180400 [Synaphobranchus kaupii]|uniref:Uncharacterized protein n=1 Tax=Synaphobranchus kaupii TaxID=118154 RepID=A0A9Q1J1L9_SYNKA|nr:hypothetical protein SKAU_G00180400 [Synaphobranchus kaupii]